MSLISTLFLRDFARFKVERSRWLGAVLQPLIFWAMMGYGMGSNFNTSGSLGSTDSSGAGASYLSYFFPGSLVLVSLFTAMFASMSIIEDRNEGFLQSLLVRPDARNGILAGKVCSIVALTLLQTALFLCASPLAGVSIGDLNILSLVLTVALGTMCLCLFSLAFAWKINSVAGYHSIMALVLFPLWVFSGAFFPMTQTWQRVVSFCNPLSYFVTGVRQSLGQDPSEVMTDRWQTMPVNMAALVVFTALGAWVCSNTMKRTQLSAQ